MRRLEREFLKFVGFQCRLLLLSETGRSSPCLSLKCTPSHLWALFHHLAKLQTDFCHILSPGLAPFTATLLVFFMLPM